MNIKKFCVIFLTIFCFSFCSASVFANEISAQGGDAPTIVETTNEPSIVIAINKDVAIVNGGQSEMTAPILVFDKTYVDLYDVAPLLGASVQWVEDYIGFFRVNAKDKACDFTLISHWDDLINQNHKFFAKNSKIFVSLRELCELVGTNITYNDGIITIGKQTDFNRELFGGIFTYDYDDYVYKTYPFSAEYVVNPYQEYSYETMIEDAEKLKLMYPDLIKLSSIGKSVEDRDLLLIEFGRGDNRIFVCGTHHAREYITTTYLMYAIDRYSYAYRTGSMWGKYYPKEILDNITFCIVPMVNPDGVNLVQNGIYATKKPDEIASMGIYESPKYGYSAWKANMHGVDLNWNYDKDWSIEKNKNPRGSAGFTGDGPATEPETIAVSNYVDNNLFDAYVSFHTQGEIFYWAENMENPTYINEIIKKDTGFVEYRDNGTGIGGSFFDYAYRKYKKPTLTVELCPYIGNYPYPVDDFDTVWNPAKNVLLIVGNEIIYHKSKLSD